jgi:hypothetical protein
MDHPRFITAQRASLQETPVRQIFDFRKFQDFLQLVPQGFQGLAPASSLVVDLLPDVS